MLKNRLSIIASLILLSQSALFGAPFFCQSTNATYADQTLCNTACGTTCQTLTVQTSGTSGTCDTTNYSNFVAYGGNTYAISKVSMFWTDVSNLAIPSSQALNTVLQSLGSGWIGVYDPLNSTDYNTVDTARFKASDGSTLLYSNWASGQPDNRLDNADIGAVPIDGEQWAYIQSDGTWADDGYHVSYGGSYKPSRPAIVEWNGPLDCVNGTPPATTSSSTGYWCSDGSTQAQCTSQSSPACTSPAVWDSSTQQCKSGGTSTYAATATVANLCSFTIGVAPYGCGGQRFYNTITNMVPGIGYAVAPGATATADASCNITVVSSSGVQYYAANTPWTCSVTTIFATETVSSSITYTCPNGGTLSGTTCTVNTTTYAAPTCPAGTVLNTATGNCDSQICPLGNYTCADITGGVQNTDTPQGANDKTANGAKDSSGNCLGQIYIFNGNDDRCRPGGIQTGYSDCCQKGTGWFGLTQCTQQEKTLGSLRSFGQQDGQCHYIGSYCTEKWPLIGCVQDKKTYCCFSSSLARIIQEGGRPQLGISWGTPESPQCRGFTPEEFQKIDFSKVDFSDWVNNSIKPGVQSTAVSNLTNVGKNIGNSMQQ